ncbi:MAG TPA: VWA domain-containing protein, partial [candidate division WOR-3 bacterium]|nr:VWA domain-containing protein [candidate division WOR-3 bacterium]
VDVSGSMYGFPLEISKKLLRDLITGLRPTDRFNVLLFASGYATLAEQSLAANETNVARAVRFIEEQRGSGGTRLLPALEAAFALPRTKGTSRSVLVVTDGLVDVEPEAFDLIRRSLGDANVFTFGIGSSINRHLLEGMARVGFGEQFVITTPDAAPAAAERFRRYVATPVLTGVRVRFEGFDAYNVEPAGVPDVMADRPVVVFGKYRGRAAGRVIVTGRSGRGEHRQVLEVGRFTPSAKNAALRQLWARHRISLLDDYNNLRPDDKRVEEVTALGLAYNLLTRHTSFVAIDTKARTEGGRPVVVRQPLPLPEGVSDYAVGGYHAGAIGMALPSVKADRGRLLAEPAPAVVTEAEQSRGGKVSIVEVKVAGAATLAAGVRRAVKSALDELHAAYAAKLARDSNLSGTLTARLTIGPDGRVTKVEFPGPVLDRQLRAAVERILGKLAVGRTPGPVATATVTLRFGN